MPLTGSVVEQMMARFHNFYSLYKIKFKKAKCILNRCKDFLSEKNILGLGALEMLTVTCNAIEQ